MPAQHVRSMLDSIQDNGGTDDIKALGAGVREALKILDEQSKRSDEQDRLALVTLKSIEAHIKNDKRHTPKGLLIRTRVVAWGAGLGLGGYLFLRVIETISGLDKLLLKLVP